MNKKTPRKRVFIDSRIQGSLAVRVVLHWVIYISVCVAAMALVIFINDPTLASGEVFHYVVKATGPFMLVLTCALPLFIWDAVMVSHRFVGPVFRLRKSIQSAVNEGNIDPIFFRDNDFLNDLADDYNALLRKVDDLQRQVNVYVKKDDGVDADASSEQEPELAGAAEE